MTKRPVETAQRPVRDGWFTSAAEAALLAAGVLLTSHAWSATILQPDLRIAKIGELEEGKPAQMVFGPDNRLYMSVVNLEGPGPASAVSFRYDPLGNLADPKIAAATGGAVGIAFGPATFGTFNDPAARTTTAMYLTDTMRGGRSHLRVLTPGSNGLYGGTGGTNTVIVKNIAAGWHQAEQLLIQKNSNGSSSLYVGIGTRTEDGVRPFPPRPNGAREQAWGGTISWIKDLRQVNATVEDAAGFGMTGDLSSNAQPDFSNAGPYNSTAPNKLVVHSSGARTPYGLALDGTGKLWFTNNFSRAQSDGTFDGKIDPNTHVMKGYTLLDAQPGPDLKNNVHDQLFLAREKGDYGYNNINWRDDAAHSNPEAVSQAAMQAGFFDPNNLVRSVTFDNLEEPPGGFAEYDQSDIDNIVGLGPSSSADGFAFYTGDELPIEYHGKAFITRYTPSISDSSGHIITYADLVAVDPVTGRVQRIALGFKEPLAVLEDGFGNLLIADYGDRSIWRISAVPEPSTGVLLGAGMLATLMLVRRRRSR